MLSAFFLAAVQILVSRRAVMVLFLFIIMLLDSPRWKKIPRQKLWMGAPCLTLGFLLIVAKVLAATAAGIRPRSTREDARPDHHGVKPQVTAEGKTLDVTISQSELDQQDEHAQDRLSPLPPQCRHLWNLLRRAL